MGRQVFVGVAARARFFVVRSAGAPDPNPANNSSTASTTVIAPRADVQVSKTGPATARPGSDITYTLDYSNTGPDTASNVQVSDTLPAGETFKSFSFLNGATAPPSSCGLGQTISCSTASMPAGSHVQAVITVTINPARSRSDEDRESGSRLRRRHNHVHAHGDK